MLCGFVLLAQLLAGAPAQAQPAPRPEPARVSELERESALARTVSEERMVALVRALVALGPRMGGTRSGERSAQLLQKTFQEAGLDARVVEGPEAWCHQERDFRVRARRAGDEEWTVLAHAWPYGFSPAAHGTAELALESRSGAVLLAGKSKAIAKGAAAPALALIDGATTRDGAYPVVHDLAAGDANPVAQFGISKPEGELLRGWLAAGAKVEVEYALDTEIRKSRPRTVVARLPGRAGGEAWRAPYLLFCAHGDSDSGGPGADDNASGDAVVVEIARAWAAAVRDGLCPAPPHEVRFAVWGAEIRSSRDYLEKCVPADGECLGVLNYDQAGFGSGSEQLNIEPDDVPANRALIDALLGVLAEHAGESGFPARWATNKSMGGTDSYVFGDSKRFRDAARPALTLFTSAWGKPDEQPRTPGMRGESWTERDKVSLDYDNYYHSAGDTPANTTDKEPWNMGWCARVGWLGAARWLDGLK